MHKRKQFSLERAQFTEQSDDEGRHIPNQLIEMYNKQYSLMLSETKNFFADCKDIITRFITLNNIGIGFNLPIMLGTFMRIEDEATSPNRIRKQGNGSQDTRKKLQTNFNNILKKMGDVIEELLNLQVRIKSAYLGEAFNSPTKMKTRFNVPATRGTRSRKNSFSNTFLNPQAQKQNSQQQQKLRSILQKGMLPSSQNTKPVCNTKSSPSQNIDKLGNKIDNLRQQIKNSKSKQQKIWKVFNQKRPSRSMLAQNSPEQQEKDKQFKRLSDMLSDLVSQKNMSYYASPYETVDSSFRM